MHKNCKTFITSCVLMPRLYVQYILETKRTLLLVLYLKSMMWQNVSHCSAHLCRTILEKWLWLLQQRKKTEMHKNCKTFTTSCVLMPRLQVQYILETKRTLLLVLYLKSMMWQNVSHCSAHLCRTILEKWLWLLQQRKKTEMHKNCKTFITSYVLMPRLQVQYILETKRTLLFVLYLKSMMWQNVSHCSAHLCRTILEKWLWLLQQRKKTEMHKNCKTFTTSCVLMPRLQVQYILETKRTLLLVLYLKSMMWQNVSHCRAHLCRTILEKWLWLLQQRKKTKRHKNCKTFTTSCVLMPRLQVQYILETKRTLLLVLYLKSMMWQNVSHCSAHLCRTILEKWLWLLQQRKKTKRHKNCKTFITSYVLMPRLQVQYILETKRTSLFLLYK